VSDLILPPTLALLLMAFTPCFQARSGVVFQWLVVGWIQCQERRTLKLSGQRAKAGARNAGEGACLRLEPWVRTRTGGSGGGCAPGN
jgi:hypothetical protein